MFHLLVSGRDSTTICRSATNSCVAGLSAAEVRAGAIRATVVIQHWVSCDVKPGKLALTRAATIGPVPAEGPLAGSPKDASSLG
jgi:hypothetical protein